MFLYRRDIIELLGDPDRLDLIQRVKDDNGWGEKWDFLVSLHRHICEVKFFPYKPLLKSITLLKPEYTQRVESNILEFVIEEVPILKLSMEMGNDVQYRLFLRGNLWEYHYSFQGDVTFYKDPVGNEYHKKWGIKFPFQSLKEELKIQFNNALSI